jgi:dihydroneopterin aldolase
MKKMQKMLFLAVVGCLLFIITGCDFDTELGTGRRERERQQKLEQSVIVSLDSADSVATEEN